MHEKPDSEVRNRPKLRVEKGISRSVNARLLLKSQAFIGLVAFVLLGVDSALFLFLRKANYIGWGASLVVFALAFFAQRRLASKGCLVNLAIWLGTGAVLLLIQNFTASAGF